MGSPKEIEALTRGPGGSGEGALGPVTWVSAGGIHSAAVVGKNVYTWGGSSYGQVRCRAGVPYGCRAGGFGYGVVHTLKEQSIF